MFSVFCFQQRVYFNSLTKKKSNLTHSLSKIQCSLSDVFFFLTGATRCKFNHCYYLGREGILQYVQISILLTIQG